MHCRSWILGGLLPPVSPPVLRLCNHHRHHRSRSSQDVAADVHTCTVPLTQSRLGDRSFGVAGPRLWNSLPAELRQQDIYLTEFRRLLQTFLQRVSIACYAERCISYDRFCLTDRPSDRPSVTRWYHAKTTPATIVRSSLEDSPMTLVSSTLDLIPKFQREHRERGRRMREG